MGGVVPPGNPKTRKTPDQAARKSQSVNFAHLSDILGIFEVFWKSHFFHFSDFNFVTFSLFAFLDFVTFLCFVTFSLFPVFVFWWFLSLFVTFSCCWWIVITFCCQIRCLNYDTLFFWQTCTPTIPPFGSQIWPHFGVLIFDQFLMIFHSFLV